MTWYGSGLWRAARGRGGARRAVEGGGGGAARGDGARADRLAQGVLAGELDAIDRDALAKVRAEAWLPPLPDYSMYMSDAYTETCAGAPRGAAWSRGSRVQNRGSSERDAPPASGKKRRALL